LTPIGLGATLMYAYVLICQAGVCALACGNVIDALIESRNSAMIVIAIVLFLAL